MAPAGSGLNFADASFVDELRRRVSAGATVFGRWEGDEAEAECVAHSHDHSFHPGQVPGCVCYAASTADVAACMRLCRGRRVPLVARGAGTGIEGGAIPPAEGCCVVSLVRLTKVEVNVEERLATVGAGVLKLALAKALKPHGLLFGPDPSSNPSLGGMASTGGSGMSTMMWGTTKENVRGLTVVTCEGDVIEATRRARVRKSSTGYDLTNLYMGSEGTLGIITELVVKLQPIPKHRVGAVVAFSDIRPAVETVVSLQRAGFETALRCELMNAEGVRVTNAIYETTLKEAPTLFLEFVGDDAEAPWAQCQAAVAMARARGAAPDPLLARDGAALDHLWEGRRGCYLAASRYRKATGQQQLPDAILVTDVCVPIPALAECVSETEADFRGAGIPCVICAHIADGNFHCLVPYQPSDRGGAVTLEHRLIDRALAHGGTVSGEHGVGLGKREHICREHGDVAIGVMRKIKQALDPDGILNAGKVLLPGGGPKASQLHPARL